VVKRLHLLVKGDVQGVFYRHHASKKARDLELTGWIRNEPNGDVSISVEGESDALKDFVDWAWEGSPMAEVADVDATENEATSEFEDFKII